MLICQYVIDEISRSLGLFDYESGGLIGSRNGDILDVFYYDEGRRSNDNEYAPSVDELQKQLNNWSKEHIEFKGIIHSHIISDRLSPQYIQMAYKIISMNTLSSILMPVFLISEQSIIWYEVNKDSVICIEPPMVL